MNRIDRLMGLLTVLQSRKHVSAEKLAEKFDVSPRTVYRDIKVLNEIGVPVNFEVNRGYFIAQGYFLPPLVFTVEEANALILLQTLAGRFAEKSVSKNSVSALNKIKTVVRSHDREAVEEIAAQMDIFGSANGHPETTWLTAIQQGIASKYCIKIGYTDTKGNHTVRDIEPVGLVFYTSQWHLIAWCDLRLGYRDFKVPMITSLFNTTIPFTKQHTFKIEDYIKFF